MSAGKCPTRRAALLISALATLGLTTPVRAQLFDVSLSRDCARPCVGPEGGALVLGGGGDLGPDVIATFLRLAGGPDARIVLIPTASASDNFPEDGVELGPLLEAGARQVTILHTRDPGVADSEPFVAPLEEADGVWISGGREWRLVDAYLGTRTQEALRRVLERGGVVGGTSAGASILAEYLVRGGKESNDVIMARGYEDGFGLLQDVAVDQHLIARHRETDLLEVLAMYPHLLGLGIDEGTALVVRGDRAVAIGRSRVAVYDRGGWVVPVAYRWLDAGDAYDLGTRTRITIADEEQEALGL